MAQPSKWHHLLILLMAWMVTQSLIRFLGLVGAGLIVTLLGLFAATLYGLRFENALMSRLYQKPILRHWIDLVCRMSGEQRPPDVTTEGQSRMLRLHTAEDFQWSIDQIDETIHGQSDAIEVIMDHLRKEVLLRGRSEQNRDLSPLGCFVLLGSPGIGKRTIAENIGAQLFCDPASTVINMANYSDGQSAQRLLGLPGQVGELVAGVKRYPQHTIILENLEAASSQAIDVLQSVVMHGRCIDGATGGEVSFRNCLIFVTSTRVPKLALDDSRSLDREELVTAFVDSAQHTHSLLNLANACLFLPDPDDTTKAKVILQLMSDECRKYKLNLDYVEPELVAREVDYFSSATGFEQSKIRLSHWMHDPIHLAHDHGLESLVLTSRMAEQFESAAPNPLSNSNTHQQLATQGMES